MKEKLVDDLAGMVGGAFGLLADIRDQVRGDMRDRLRDVADRIDLVTRDEYMALEARIAALETKLAGQKPAAAKAEAAPKATSKKAAKPTKTKKKSRS